jgi:anti-sigma factor RsiW
VARELTPAELDELLGAYALDAVDDDEREQLDTYLERSDDARRQLAELRETAALLAYEGGASAPDELWGRIEDALAVEPPRLVLPLDHARTRRNERPSRGMVAKIAVGIAAASAVAAGVTAVLVTDQMSRQEDRLDEMAQSVAHEGMRSAAAAAAADPRSQVLHLASPTSDAAATVVSMPDGTAFVMGHHIPRLEEGRTYQLWTMTGVPANPAMVPTAVLGRTVGVASFRAPADGLGFVVSEEDAPGSTSPAAEHFLEGHYS